MTKTDTFSYELAKKRLEQIQQQLDSGKANVDELESMLITQWEKQG
jgi:exonuclease VII small subunit